MVCEMFGVMRTLRMLIITFSSKRHGSHSRIDFILASENLLEWIGYAEIGDRTISHHVPISAAWLVERRDHTCRGWWLNNLLEVTGIDKYIHQGFENFYEWNKGTVPTITLWETCKVFMRGHLITFRAVRDERRDLERVKIMDTIKELELEIKRRGSQEKVACLQLAYDELKLIDAGLIAWEILYSKQ